MLIRILLGSVVAFALLIWFFVALLQEWAGVDD